ncbi:cytochrome c [Phormidium yuhuli AB48]|uniref:Cytochrome c n=1 Tax=Phormidium yuhuli AB48 TaxID=2940671 RepID=A0ABY5AP77_9CYAN|nr:cytochrome c [Phormidium yuhuli]USR90652.1 cytochrome c [Phormidium yuhuli AB48]
MTLITRFFLTVLLALLVVFSTGDWVKGYPRDVSEAQDGKPTATYGDAIALDAQPSPDRDLVIAYRRRYMSALSGHYRSLEEILENEAPFSEHTLTHIEALVSLAELMPDVFPPGTGMMSDDDWGAKPSIWEELDNFSQLIANFQANLEGLKLAAMESQTSVNLTDSFAEVREGCLDCHRLYRVRQP